MRIGVIDVGTNSVRVLIADAVGNRLEERERDLIITRLGEGVDGSGTLRPEPLRRTVAAVQTYAERSVAAGAERLRIIATSAVRDAANREDFTRAVRDATGVEPEILGGEREARLGFLGATLDLPSTSPYLVCDIGGGSTELVRGTARAERWISLDIGSVRLTERHIRTDPPEAGEIAAVRADADAHLSEAVDALGAGRAGTLVGLAGTITTVAAIALDLPGYVRDAVHHAPLTREGIAAIGERLAGMTSAERRELPAMPPGREDVIVAGVTILEQVMERFGVEECLVSESDILDGAAFDMVAPDPSETV